MLISSQNNTYLMKRMETFNTVITPVRRNVARKSTANRPLLNTVIKEPRKHIKKNDYIFDESIVSKAKSFKSYPSYEPHDFGLYFKDDITNTSKTSLINDNIKKYDSSNEPIYNYIENSANSLMYDESEDEEINLSGVFCVSEDMTKYLNESILSPPTNYDSSDESIDLSRVRNYPVKIERCKNEQLSIPNKVSSPSKESVLDAGKNIKQELFSEVINEENIQSVIVNQDSLISDDNSITELGTQTKKCLFDPNLESVTCKVKVREEVLVCENVPLKMTILEANFDVDHLENIVEENSFKVDIVSEKDDVTIVPQVICAMSLGNDQNSEFSETTNSQAADEQKKSFKKAKKSSFKKELLKTSDNKTDKLNTINEKRLTRSQMHVMSNTKRITRNSTRLNYDALVLKEGMNSETNLGSINDNELKIDVKNELNNESPKLDDSSNKNQSKISLPTENVDTLTDKEDKIDCKKKANLDKKGKKDINEGVLLHVEATKETELMRDGKIIKDKEEYLKDIESKIDQNLPVVVEKEFDIQQSLTEEILLDQALRLAHQRTSPRLSKIMKEAILKASVQKPSSKPKQNKSNCNKLEIKSKGIKIPSDQKHNSEEADTSDSVLNNLESECDLDQSFNMGSLDADVDEKVVRNDNQQRKKKENYVITPVVKQTNVENTVEPLTIKICRKTNKKKTGFRLSLKKKRSPKKKEGVISKPVCSKDVNMDDLSKTFEDILQDDNWCTGDKLNDVDSENFADKEEKILNTELTENKNINTKDPTNDKKEILVINTKNNEIVHPLPNNSSEFHSGDITREEPIYDNTKNLHTIDSKINIKKEEAEKKERKNDGLLSGSNNSVQNSSKPYSFGEDSECSKDSSIPLLSETSTPSLNSNNSALLSSQIGTVTDVTSEKSNDINLEDSSNNRNTDSSKDSDARNNALVVSSFPIKSSTDELNKLSIPPISCTDSSKDVSSTKPQLSVNSSDILSQLQSSLSESPPKNSYTLSNGINKPLANSKIFGNQIDQVHQFISVTDQLNNQTNNKEVYTHKEQTLDILKCPLAAPSSEIQPKVLPLSIASRDPRLRKSHVRVIVEVSTSSVSNSMGKSDIQQETRIISHVMQNMSKEIDSRKDIESDSETNENQVEMDRRKKLKKKEVDAELLYKTPLSDLHDIPERSSYTRSIRKRSPKNDKRDPRTVRRKEGNFLQNNDRLPETYREYHEINIYSKLTHQESVRGEMVGSPSEFKRNDNFSPDYRAMGLYRPDSLHPEHYNSFRGDTDLRRRENFGQNSSAEYVNEVRHTTKEFTERVHQNLSDHPRIGYQYKESEEEYRRSENYPPDYAPPDNFSRGFKRPSDFSLDHGRHESPDFREKEHVRDRTIERNHVSHNEPSYSRWDYAHKKVEGHFPPEINNEKEEKGLQPDERTNMWQEERDLIDGPVKSFSRPYYRRKKFSRGEELFERRSTPWDVDNRRYAENERLWVRKTDKELIHGPDRDMRWDRRGRKGFRDVREDRSRSPRRDHDRYTGKRSRSPGSYLKSRREASPSPQNSPLVLDSPMSPEPADRYCVLEPTKCLTVPQ